MMSILGESDSLEIAGLASIVAKRGTIAMSVIVCILGIVCLTAGAVVHNNLDTNLEPLPFLSYQATTLPVLVLVWGLLSSLVAVGIGFLVVKRKDLLKSDKRFVWGCFGAIIVMIVVSIVTLGLFISNNQHQTRNIYKPCAAAWPHLLAPAQLELNTFFKCCGWKEPCTPEDINCKRVIPEYIMDKLANTEGSLIVLLTCLLIFAIFFELFRRYSLEAAASTTVRSYDELQGLAHQESEEEEESEI